MDVTIDDIVFSHILSITHPHDSCVKSFKIWEARGGIGGDILLKLVWLKPIFLNQLEVSIMSSRGRIDIRNIIPGTQ